MTPSPAALPHPGSVSFSMSAAYGATGDGKTARHRRPSIAPLRPRPPRAEAWSYFLRGSTSASPSVSRATCTSISSRAQPSSPPIRRSPAKPPATTAVSTTPPSPTIPGSPIRTTATTTGTTRSFGARTFTTSPSPAPASSTARDSVSARVPATDNNPDFAASPSGPPALPPHRSAPPNQRAWRLSDVPGRAARRRQQGHRPQELPQRHLARLLHPQGRPLRLAAHRRRQPHHRQPHDRHRSRRHRHRLLPERPRLQLHRQFALGRRHLPQVELRARLCARHAQCHHRQLLRHRLLSARAPCSTAHSRNFPPRPRPYGTGRIKCGTESNGGFINITITNCVFEGCQGYALESVDGALLEDITITNTTMRDLASGPLFMRLGARLRGPKDTTKVGTLKRILISNLNCHNAPSASGLGPQRHPRLRHRRRQALQHLRRNRWRRHCPMTPRSCRPSRKMPIPSPACFGPTPSPASSSATCAISK